MSTLPDYVSDRGHAEISFAVPLQIKDVTAYGFVLKSDGDRLQRFVDEQLNAVSGGKVRYSACSFVIHVYIEAKHCTSAAEVIGWLPDRESLIWVPVWQKRQGHLLPELKIWIPYLLIDQQSGMVTGREVWGYRKTLATIEVPSGPDDAAAFSVKTTIFKKFDANTQGQDGATLLRTIRKSAPQAAAATSSWDGFGQAARDIVDRLKGAEIEFQILSQDVLSAFFKGPLIHVVNLKQFRDAVDSTKACYQALVDSPCRLDAWKGGGLLPGDYELEVTSCDSHRIVSGLGLSTVGGGEPQIVRPKLAFWWRMDFSTQPGSIVWQAA
jgi:hypothetical protein